MLRVNKDYSVKAGYILHVQKLWSGYGRWLANYKVVYIYTCAHGLSAKCSLKLFFEYCGQNMSFKCDAQWDFW